jgi:hypothetical protein
MSDELENKDNAPDAEEEQPKPQDKPEFRTFNQDAREAVEAAYDAFQQEAEPAPEPAPVEDKPADKGFDVEASKKEPEAEPKPDEWNPEFKDKKTAEESYRHARMKMQEALERASRLEKQYEEAQARLSQPRPQQAPTEPPPQLDKEAIEAEFFRDPVGFQLAMTEAMARRAVEEAEAKITEKDRISRAERLQASMTQKLNEHFDATYSDLKPFEPMVLSIGDQLRQDEKFMTPLLETIKLAPPQLKARKIFDVSKAIMDESAKRLREQLPTLVKPLGLAGQRSERLTSGAPAIVPGGSGGPVINQSPPAPETNQDYMRERQRMSDRLTAGAGRWRR